MVVIVLSDEPRVTQRGGNDDSCRYGLGLLRGCVDRVTRVFCEDPIGTPLEFYPESPG